jgi:hypothetical protein
VDEDGIADVADRLQRASDFEFEVEWGTLTDEERDAFMALNRRHASPRSGPLARGGAVGRENTSLILIDETCTGDPR